MFAIKTTRGRATAIAASTALIAAGIVGLSSSAAQAAGAATLSPKLGPAVTVAAPNGQLINVTGTGFTLTQAQLTTGLGTGLVAFNPASTCPAAAATGGTILAPQSVTKVSSTRLVIMVPTADFVVGNYKLCIYNAAGTSLVSSGTFTAWDVATVTNVRDADDANSGSTLGGQTVSITGTNFRPGSTVTIGGTAATKVKVVSATKITCVVPAHDPAAAAVDAVVTPPTGQGAAATGAGLWTYKNTITVSPTSQAFSGDVAATVTGEQLTITGEGFNAAQAAGNELSVIFMSRVVAGQTEFTAAATYGQADADDNDAVENAIIAEAAITVVSDTEIVVSVPAELQPGTYQVVVTDDDDLPTALNTTEPATTSVFTVY